MKAGGSGLNLTGADTVIHYDMWWNPAVENQATDRVHRIGQTASVSAYKLVTLNTIEEKILELQNRKRGLVKKVVSCDEEAVAKLTWEEVLNCSKLKGLGCLGEAAHRTLGKGFIDRCWQFSTNRISNLFGLRVHLKCDRTIVIVCLYSFPL